MLAIEIEFLTGRYVATAYNTRLEAEWPPHPARLFSALVATHFEDAVADEEERRALEWLEAQGPPSICASEASHRDVTTVFVPVNDVAMTNVDEQAAAVDEGRNLLADAEISGEAKEVKKARSALRKAKKRLNAGIARNIGVPKASANPDRGLAVLPEARVRQPRTFPSVTPADPTVTFVWPTAELTQHRRLVLAALLGRLVRLGHSSSFVAARVVDHAVTPVWRPAPGGELILRTVRPGQLEALDRAYELHRETEPRVLPARFESYTSLGREEERTMPRASFAEDWLVLRRVGGPLVPMSASVGVAQTTRRALLAYADEPVAEVLSGHAPGGGPSERDHLAVVPLPFVGHSEASGAILGVALVLPRSASSDDRYPVYRAVHAWEQAVRKEDEDTPSLPLTLGAAGMLELERVEWGGVPASLRPATWCQPAKVWCSVTPVALDRNPGELRTRDPAKLRAAVEEATATIGRACARIGLPSPTKVEILPAAPWAGAAKAKKYPRFPRDSARTQRVLTHVRIEFAERVRGPVLLGAGRYLGLGLFRPQVTRG